MLRKTGSTRRRSEREDESEEALALVERFVEEVRSRPVDFPNAEALADYARQSEAQLDSLLRQHYHVGVADMLLRARLEFAKAMLLARQESSAVIARRVGFGSVAQFREAFVRRNGMTPDEYRRLPTARTFHITLPVDYPLPYLRRALGRDQQSVTERLDGDTFTAAIRVGPQAHVLKLVLSQKRVSVTIDPLPADIARIHAVVTGLLGLDQPTEALFAQAKQIGLERLVAGRIGLRVHQTFSVYDGLLWAIIGQQINLPFAFLLKRRLMELTGTAVAGGMFAPPDPASVARLEPRDLLPLQYSRQKADYVVSISRLIAEGKLDLEPLRTASATRAERTLLAVRGLGVWSVNYVMMRSLGFADCLPVGDTGVTSGLRTLLELEERPDAETTKRLMAPLSPYRSLATAHLWQVGRAAPE